MKPDLDAIRARCEAARVILDPRSVVMPCIEDIPVLLAHVDMLEHMLAEERENVDNLQDMVADLEGRTTYAAGETEWANRIAHAEARFVEEYDAHQETRRTLTDLFYKQLKADAEQMRSYGIGQVGVRNLLVDFQNEELSLGKVVDLLRAAAREMAREQVEELKARIVTLEAMR